ncbi:SCO family protein [Simplicispira lacusdiani]|uniref:SCO family protein n=1 Tax=Simplicispira lacusdiani TaxID=2213010 RepID=UPI000E70EC6D|nr:SCO family protein [Simplicispira lacusdiani]
MHATVLLRGYLAVVLCLAMGLLLPLSSQAASSPDMGLDREQALRLSQEAIGRKVGDHTLLDREGRPVRLSSYRGKPLLVSFIYTGCFQVCPTTTRSLQETVQGLQKVFGTNQFNVVSIGFNQPDDSPVALKAFAAQYQINQPSWEFLSPSMSTIGAIAKDFGFVYAPTPAGFDHVLQVSLLDADGRIVRQIYGESIMPAEIGEPIKLLLSGAPVEPATMLDDVMDRVRILCTVYDPKTGSYRVDYTLPIQIAGGVTFFILMLVFFFNEWRSNRPGARTKGARRV